MITGLILVAVLSFSRICWLFIEFIISNGCLSANHVVTLYPNALWGKKQLKIQITQWYQVKRSWICRHSSMDGSTEASEMPQMVTFLFYFCLKTAFTGSIYAHPTKMSHTEQRHKPRKRQNTRLKTEEKKACWLVRYHLCLYPPWWLTQKGCLPFLSLIVHHRAAETTRCAI